ncbi:hypothetical protein DP130_11370 [Clostridium tetani]|uniref:DUF58 domain-containing protein n=1 Tax=Clostridium tetani TaxID=1513 RepID=A0A4Q0V9M7_CLOTA|nr:DUF58 domain-containing protein [Clostridium tetani]RXI46156.1 hypothetical protein DP130_11370 [Clostridium tetani]
MEKFLSELEQASILIRSRISGSLTGNYKSSALGNSYDFYGIRPYYEGDNIRNVDWKAFGRSEKIYTKLFTEQKQINVSILLDSSKSMDFGKPTKWHIGKMCAIGLSYITLKELNRLNLYSFNKNIQLNLNNLNSKKLFYEVLKNIENIQPKDETNLKDIIRTTNSSNGVLFIITDLLSENIKEFLQSSKEKYEKVVLIHMMSEEELNPNIKGKIKFIDSETGEEKIGDVGEKEIKLYKEKVREFVSECKYECEKRGIKYIFAKEFHSPVQIIMKAIEVE